VFLIFTFSKSIEDKIAEHRSRKAGLVYLTAVRICQLQKSVFSFWCLSCVHILCMSGRQLCVKRDRLLISRCD